MKEQAIQRIERKIKNNLNSINTTDIAYENNYNLNQNTNDFIDSILDEKSSDNEIQNGEITDEKYINKCINENKKQIKILTSETKISLLFEQLNLKYDYKKLENVEKIYIPLKYFLYNNYKEIISTLGKKGKIIYLYATCFKR